jgi:hypothetical protein
VSSRRDDEFTDYVAASPGALAMARRLHLLGTNPAAWTTDPVS